MDSGPTLTPSRIKLFAGKRLRVRGRALALQVYRLLAIRKRTNLDLEGQDPLPLQNSHRRQLAAMNRRAPRGLRDITPRFRHEGPADNNRSQSHAHDGIETRGTAKALGDKARQRGAECGTDAAEGPNNALPKIEAPGASRDVGYNEWREHANYGPAYPVKHLDGHEQHWIVNERKKSGAEG